MVRKASSPLRERDFTMIVEFSTKITAQKYLGKWSPRSRAEGALAIDVERLVKRGTVWMIEVAGQYRAHHHSDVTPSDVRRRMFEWGGKLGAMPTSVAVSMPRKGRLIPEEEASA